MTSALYELGGPGTRQTTMRPSGRTAQAPEAGGEPIRLPSVYMQSGAVPGLLRMCVVSPELVSFFYVAGFGVFGRHKILCEYRRGAL